MQLCKYSGLTFMEDKEISKFLSLVLRHSPNSAGIILDEGGWANVEQILHALQTLNQSITREDLDRIVRLSDKRRFSFSEDNNQIRANHGHSVPIKLAYKPKQPPTLLYHGTADVNSKSIEKHGLLKATRQYVHLSLTREIALGVGQRHGKPVLISVDAARMHSDGYQFFEAGNGVWLTEFVPVNYLTFIT